MNKKRISTTICPVVGYILILVAILTTAGEASSNNRPMPTSSQRPRLIIDDSVARDFAVLALETWDLFLAVFQNREACFGDVYLKAAHDLDSRASYNPDSATVTVRVPGTPAMLQGALVHEWAHHIEFQCEEHQALRSAFRIAQGLPLDTPWRPDDTPVNAPASDWADIPSEHYAEATIELVLGERPIPTKIRVTREAVRVIAAWARGD